MGIVVVREVDEARLRELCEELLGPTYVVDSSSPSRAPSKHDKNHHWNPEILVSLNNIVSLFIPQENQGSWGSGGGGGLGGRGGEHKH